jgi:DNA-binding protein HU-beta
MNKSDLINKIAEQTDFSKADSERAVNACLASIEDALVKEGKLTLTGFGTFSIQERKERKGRNPQTGKEMNIPASKSVKFKPGKNLRVTIT